MNTALYAGTFDPLTNRHFWMVATGALLFDRLVVAVDSDPQHETMFTGVERVEMVHQCAESIGPERIVVAVVKQEGLARCAQEHGCRFLLRRMPSRKEDDRELALRGQNFGLPRSIRPVFLVPDPEVVGSTSRVVRSLVGTPGWKEVVKAHVWVPVWEALLERAKRTSGPDRYRR